MARGKKKDILNGKAFGYCRCTTEEEKHNVSKQIADVISIGADKDYIYVEYGNNPKRDRKEFNRLLEEITEGDGLFVTDLCYISRSMTDLLRVLDILKDKKVRVVIGTAILDFRNDVDPTTVGMVQMMGIFSQMDKEIISQRIKSGVDNAKANGKVLGRKKVTTEDVPKQFRKYYVEYKSRLGSENPMSITALGKLTEVKSRTTVYKYIKLLDEE